jgi:hypothetical protein
MGVTPEELAQTYPQLYHMADAQSWNSIRKYGLLSTSALLDLFEVNGIRRVQLEARRRPMSEEITHAEHGRAIVRDQSPLVESKLLGCLKDCTLEDWYCLLNRQVYFWLTKGRLQTLLCAQKYRDHAHIVLTLDTLDFARRYENRIVLSPMNSGNTQPIAHPRSPAIFKRMRDYPFAERAKYGDHYQVVELAVEGGADVTASVLAVDVMQCCHGKGMRVVENIFTAP